MSINKKYRIFIVALLATLLLMIVYFVLNKHYTGIIWQTMLQSKSALTAEYCELDCKLCFFRQRVNTYSNLMYFFLGMLVLQLGIYDQKNKNTNGNAIQQFPLLSCFFGACLVYLCFGSSFFHASLTWIGQRADMNGTYSICLSLIVITYYRLYFKTPISRNIQRRIILGLFLIVVFFIKLHIWLSSLILLPFLIFLLILGSSINYYKSKNSFNAQYAFLSILFLLLAAVLRILDVQKVFCNPISCFQGHSLWHFFTGMSAFLLYWFYRNEKITDKS